MIGERNGTNGKRTKNKMNYDLDDGKRYRVRYRDNNLYVVCTPRSLDMSMVSLDVKDDTLTGLGIISTLVTMLMEEEIDREIIAGMIWTQSRHKNDLADTLASLIIKDTE